MEGILPDRESGDLLLSIVLTRAISPCVKAILAFLTVQYAGLFDVSSVDLTKGQRTFHL